MVSLFKLCKLDKVNVVPLFELSRHCDGIMLSLFKLCSLMMSSGYLYSSYAGLFFQFQACISVLLRYREKHVFMCDIVSDILSLLANFMSNLQENRKLVF
jgi:hypothetical protein